MRRTIKHYFLLNLLLSSLFSYSQSNFHRGYVVNKVGDTTKGYVRMTDKLASPKFLEFKLDRDAAVQEFTVLNCLAFGLGDAVQYERHNIKLSLGATAAKRLSVGIDTSFKNDIVFLKVLDKGNNITLFRYADNHKERFYVRVQDELPPYELLYYSFLDPADGVSIVKNNRIFRGQLILLAKRFGLSTSQIDKLIAIDYDLTDIMAAARAINHKSKFKFPPVSFYFGMGANKHIMYSVLQDSWKGSYQSVVKPFVNIGVDVFANPATRRLVFRFATSMSLSENKFTSNNPTPTLVKYTYNLERLDLSLSAQLLYNFYNGQNLKFYLGAGGSMDYARFLKYEEIDEFINNDVDVYSPIVRSLNPSVPFSIGGQFYKRFEFFGSYNVIPGIDGAVHHNAKQIRVGVNYHFGKQ